MYFTMVNVPLACLILDVDNWQEEENIASQQACKEACQTDHQWMVYEMSKCYCLDSISTGFWSDEDCPGQTVGIDSGTIHRLWNMRCPALDHLPEKNLFLRDVDPGFYIGSKATYECPLGYAFANKVTLQSHIFL